MAYHRSTLPSADGSAVADGEAQEETGTHSPDVHPTHDRELREVKRVLGDLRQEADRAALRASDQVCVS
jgi:hypothetical protein